MDLFKRDKKNLPPLISDAELDGASYAQVLDFLTGISQSDFEKVIKVVNTQRKANEEVAKITGLEPTVSRSIFERQDPEPDTPSTDTELGNFMEEPSQPKRKGTKEAEFERPR